MLKNQYGQYKYDFVKIWICYKRVSKRVLCLGLLIYEVVDHAALNSERLKAQEMNQFGLMMQDGKLCICAIGILWHNTSEVKIILLSKLKCSDTAV